MPFAVSELAKEASVRGAERLVTWVPEWNPHVRRYMERIGFEPFAIRRERYRFFRRRVWFERTDGSTWAQAGMPSAEVSYAPRLAIAVSPGNHAIARLHEHRQPIP